MFKTGYHAAMTSNYNFFIINNYLFSNFLPSFLSKISQTESAFTIASLTFLICIILFSLLIEKEGH